MIFLHLPEAHALVAKQDLPIPAWLFAWAASIVLVVSFFALSAAWRKPQFEEERWRPSAAWLTTVLRSWPIQAVTKKKVIAKLRSGASVPWMPE